MPTSRILASGLLPRLSSVLSRSTALQFRRAGLASEVGLDKNEMTGHITVVKPNVRERLLETGLRILHERGFNATGVQDITEAAGVPKGAFYNHFEGKEDSGAKASPRHLETLK